MSDQTSKHSSQCQDQLLLLEASLIDLTDHTYKLIDRLSNVMTDAKPRVNEEKVEKITLVPFAQQIKVVAEKIYTLTNLIKDAQSRIEC